MLYVNERQIACDERNAFGAVFNGYDQGFIENAFIAIIPNSDVQVPESILMTFKLQGKHFIFYFTEHYIF